MLLEFVRRYQLPLVVLPKNHPGSSRLKMVVAVGDEILLACDIQRGTHPEQNLICSSGELAGIHLSGSRGVVEVENMPPDVLIEYGKPYENRKLKEQ
jgi:hypothetical protein